MEIIGPLNIGVLDNDTGGRELHLSFKPKLRMLSVQQQTVNFQAFITTLINDLHKLEVADANRQGMNPILQISDQLNPHIDSNELPL